MNCAPTPDSRSTLRLSTRHRSRPDLAALVLMPHQALHGLIPPRSIGSRRAPSSGPRSRKSMKRRRTPSTECHNCGDLEVHQLQLWQLWRLCHSSIGGPPVMLIVSRSSDEAYWPSRNRGHSFEHPLGGSRTHC